MFMLWEKNTADCCFLNKQFATLRKNSWFMNRIVYWSRYFSTSREVRFVPLLAIVHDVISFKQVIQVKHPAFKVIAVSNYEVMLTISNTWLEVFQANPSHPHCQCFCLSGAHPASAGRASKVKIGRFLWNCVIYFFSCVIYFFLGAWVLFKPRAWAFPAVSEEAFRQAFFKSN